MSEDRNKILDRIRKLYAMSQQGEASINEATMAAKRCRSLMDKHGISEADLATSEFLQKVIGAHKKRPKWWSVLTLGVAKANDVILSSGRASHRGALTSEFKGYEQDVLMAELMLETQVSGSGQRLLA